MRCPVHPDIWLYEDFLEEYGVCPTCQKEGKKGVYKLKENEDK